jgi:hypothetical protein
MIDWCRISKMRSRGFAVEGPERRVSFEILRHSRTIICSGWRRVRIFLIYGTRAAIRKMANHRLNDTRKVREGEIGPLSPGRTCRRIAL